MPGKWDRRTFLRATATTVGTGIPVLSAAAPAAGVPALGPQASKADGARGLRVVRTTVEYAENVLGTDVVHPRLAWELASSGRGARQTAYRIQVKADAAGWARSLVWDSGKVTSANSVGVAYGGPALKPRTRYTWRVKVWDGQGKASAWSAPRWWETTLSPEKWGADWIGVDNPTPLDFTGASWIWATGASLENAPVGTRWFRSHLDLPGDGEVLKATVVATADDDFALYLNGRESVQAPQQQDGWRSGRTADVTHEVREAAAAGPGVALAARATNRAGASVNPAGLLVRLRVETSTGRTYELLSDAGWRVTDTEQQGWQEPEFDDSAWPAAVVLAPYGQGPWGTGVSVALPEQPAPLLRREFDIPRRVSRARLHISGLAYYEARINGRRVGRQVLDPGFTDYDETVLYTVHDVTELLRRGANAIGVSLGRGFFGMTTPNVWNWHRPPWHSEPRLVARLEIEYPDGSRTEVVTDDRWRITEGPTLSNSLYAGETYDARREPGPWTSPGFDDSSWRPATVQSAPKGRLRAQPHDGIEVIDSFHPEKITRLAPRGARGGHGPHDGRLGPRHGAQPPRGHAPPAHLRREAESRQKRVGGDVARARPLPARRIHLRRP